MDKGILIISALVIGLVMHNKAFTPLMNVTSSLITADYQQNDNSQSSIETTKHLSVNKSPSRYIDQSGNWKTAQKHEDFKATSSSSIVPSSKDISKPQEVSWPLLMDIDYKLKYFKKIDMEIYAPVFSEAVKALDGKEVAIKGYVIPIDEKGELLALSAMPYSSCFFCGQASPASVISVYLKDKGKKYKTDDLRKFRGILTLNYDDPDELYYILKEAQ